MIGIDTNILIRYLAQDDDRQSKIAADILNTRCTAENPGYITVIAIDKTAAQLPEFTQLDQR